uniref:(northern house mosquito) hypothetical protein n=1 Tax=Culex pipiens TaxID=7175 RepID=A0A8D8NA06_CULPI
MPGRSGQNVCLQACLGGNQRRQIGSVQIRPIVRRTDERLWKCWPVCPKLRRPVRQADRGVSTESVTCARARGAIQCAVRLARVGSCLWRSKGEHCPWYAREKEV